MASGPEQNLADMPRSVLFMCGMNAVRSPIAEALARQALPATVFVASAGVHAGARDPFVDAVLAEDGLSLENRQPRTIDDLERLGIIARTRSDTDRRSWLLSLTEHGDAMIARTQQCTRAVADELFGGIEPAALASLHDVLAAVPGPPDAGSELARASPPPPDA